MSNEVRYLAFDVTSKKRVNLGGGDASKTKFKSFRGNVYDFRILLYRNKDDFYTTASTTFALRIREKRTSTTDLANALTAAFVDADWLAGDNIKQIYISSFDKELPFNEGDNIQGATSLATGVVMGFSADTGCLVYEKTTGDIVDAESVRSYKANGEESGASGISVGTPTALIGDKANGKLAVTMSLNTQELYDFMEAKESYGFIFELEEVDGDDVQKLLGQTDISIDNAFIVSGLTTTTPISYFPAGWT